MWDKVVGGKHHSLGVRVGTVIAAGVIALTLFTNKIIAEGPADRIDGGTSFTKNSYYEARGVFGEGRFNLDRKTLEFKIDGEKTNNNEVAANTAGALSIPDSDYVSTYRTLVKGGFSYMSGIHSKQQSWSVGLNFPINNFIPTANLNLGGGDVAGMNFNSSGYDVGMIYRQEVGSVDLGVGGACGTQKQEFKDANISAWTWAVNIDLSWGSDMLDWIHDEGAFLTLKQYVYEVLNEKDTTATVIVRLKPGFVDAVEVIATNSNMTNYVDNTTSNEFSFGGKFIWGGIIIGAEWMSSDSGRGTYYMLGYRYRWE